MVGGQMKTGWDQMLELYKKRKTPMNCYGLYSGRELMGLGQMIFEMFKDGKTEAEAREFLKPYGLAESEINQVIRRANYLKTQAK